MEAFYKDFVCVENAKVITTNFLKRDQRHTQMDSFMESFTSQSVSKVELLMKLPYSDEWWIARKLFSNFSSTYWICSSTVIQLLSSLLF